MLLDIEFSKTLRSTKLHTLAGAAVTAVLVVGLCSWAVFASVHSAVISPGTVVVQSDKKRVQHQDGGIVAALMVAEGDRVQAGDVLIRLDGKQLTSEVGIIRKRMFELTARRRRLTAELEDPTHLDGTELVADPEQAQQDPSLAQIIAVQIKVFGSRREMQEGRKAQLRERIKQLKDEIEGLTRLAGGKSAELESFTTELADLAELRKKNLVSTARYNSVFRDRSRLEGEVGQVQADMARNRGRISETELQILELNDRFRTDALAELQTIDGEFMQLVERRAAAEDKLQRLDIKAPDSGRVHELAMHTVGGVARPGDTLLYIVPDTDRLVVDVKIRPRDIDQVVVSMPARIRFTAFNRRTTPELLGRVTSISADQSVVSENQEPFFRARVMLNDGEAQRLAGQNILPGMQAEVMILSGPRTVMSYFVKPVVDQLHRAFRER